MSSAPSPKSHANNSSSSEDITPRPPLENPTEVRRRSFSLSNKFKLDKGKSDEKEKTGRIKGALMSLRDNIQDGLGRRTSSPTLSAGHLATTPETTMTGRVGASSSLPLSSPLSSPPAAAPPRLAPLTTVTQSPAEHSPIDGSAKFRSSVVNAQKTVDKLGTVHGVLSALAAGVSLGAGWLPGVAEGIRLINEMLGQAQDVAMGRVSTLRLVERCASVLCAVEESVIANVTAGRAIDPITKSNIDRLVRLLHENAYLVNKLASRSFLKLYLQADENTKLLDKATSDLGDVVNCFLIQSAVGTGAWQEQSNQDRNRDFEILALKVDEARVNDDAMLRTLALKNEEQAEAINTLQRTLNEVVALQLQDYAERHPSSPQMPGSATPAEVDFPIPHPIPPAPSGSEHLVLSTTTLPAPGGLAEGTPGKSIPSSESSRKSTGSSFMTLDEHREFCQRALNVLRRHNTVSDPGNPTMSKSVFPPETSQSDDLRSRSGTTDAPTLTYVTAKETQVANAQRAISPEIWVPPLPVVSDENNSSSSGSIPFIPSYLENQITAESARAERHYRHYLQHDFDDRLTIPLWFPSAVALGSIGYVRHGQFLLLLDPLSPPMTLGELPPQPYFDTYQSLQTLKNVVNKRNPAERGLDFVTGITNFLLSSGEKREKLIRRRVSFPLRPGAKQAALVVEDGVFEMYESLDRARDYFKANIDWVIHHFGEAHHIAKEDVIIVVGTLKAHKYAMIISHYAPKTTLHFNVHAQQVAGEPWGTWGTNRPTEPVTPELVGGSSAKFATGLEKGAAMLQTKTPRKFDEQDVRFTARVSKVSASPMDAVLLAKLRIPPADQEPSLYL